MIACLGLLGITIFSTQLKLKEISVRKVLGAGDFELYRFLSRGFLILIGISILGAVPISWFINKIWLEQLAYRISLNPFFFVAGSGIILLVALFTTGFQIWQVIKVNPAVSLRND
jgi:putative ABC transport system permease protein